MKKQNFIKKVNINIFVLVIMTICLMLVIAFVIRHLSVFLKLPNKNQENMYWLFSATAQSIATLFAFMLAGYTLFINNLDNLVLSDDSLDEIINEEKRSNYKKLRFLSIIVTVSLILNLSMIFINGVKMEYKTDLFIVTVISSVITILFAIKIIINIINPYKIKKIAEGMIFIEENYEQKGINIENNEFFNNFISLERTIRNYINTKNIDVRTKYGKIPSLKQMINSLQYTETIDNNLIEDLYEINKYRNLLFHGELEKASIKMNKKLIKIINELEIKLEI